MERRTVYIGVRELAARLNKSPSHVSRVLHGQRRSAVVEAAAREMGWRKKAAQK